MRWQSLVMEFLGCRVILSLIAFSWNFSHKNSIFPPASGYIFKKSFQICLCKVPTEISFFRTVLDQFPYFKFSHCRNDLRFHTRVAMLSVLISPQDGFHYWLRGRGHSQTRILSFLGWWAETFVFQRKKKWHPPRVEDYVHIPHQTPYMCEAGSSTL